MQLKMSRLGNGPFARLRAPLHPSHVIDTDKANHRQWSPTAQHFSYEIINLRMTLYGIIFLFYKNHV